MPAVTETTTPRSSANASQVAYTILEEHGYYVIRTIGTGSFSKVKTAHSRTEQKIVAIKVVSKSHAPTDYLNKFLPREIDVVKGLDHPNIIKYLRCIETTRRVYIIMQFAENGSLLDRIRRDGQFAESTARHIYRQLIAAIDYCHRRGLVHRDVKCENLLFDRHDVLKLIDFGFARRFDVNAGWADATVTDGSALKLSETYCGSYAYACPQILQGIPYDPHFADVWASGVVLFVMVFGRLPFDDRNFPQLLCEMSQPLNFAVSNRLRPVSELCKLFLSHVLVYAGHRSVRSVYEHTWMRVTANSPQCSPPPTSEAVKTDDLIAKL